MPRDTVAACCQKPASSRPAPDGAAAGVLPRMTITRVPVLIGRGIPPFDALPAGQRWTLVRSRHWAEGLAQAEYARPAGA
jgi:hypothetical protein